MQLSEFARAKVNLTLRVLGKRTDGFHELDSIVAFADVGDTLTLLPAERFELVTLFLDLPAQDNLVTKAVQAFSATFGPVNVQLILNKRLPVAAGIGGGSADAAAALRLLAAMLPQTDDLAANIQRQVQLMEISEQIGSDVTVCLANQLIHMRGRGHDLTPLLPIRPLPAVLVNTNARMPANKTAQVFKALAAGPVAEEPSWSVDNGAARTAEQLQALILSVGNDLEAPARRLFPGVDAAIKSLIGRDGLLVARMSGAGPTCFGFFETEAHAQAAAAEIAEAQPTWWVAATLLR